MTVCNKHLIFVFAGFCEQTGDQVTSIERFDRWDVFSSWKDLKVVIPYERFMQNIVMTQYKEDSLLIFGGGKEIGTIDYGLKINFKQAFQELKDLA